MEVITSTKNKWVKYVQQLAKPKVRKKQNEFVLEGWHLVEEALKENTELHYIFTTEEALPFEVSCPIYQVSDHVLKAMATTPTPQGIIAVAQQLSMPTIDELSGRLLVIDNVQDPGNLGTMIRTADAAGYDGVVINQGSVDVYNSKVIRSTQGSFYHLPVVYTDLMQWLPQFISQGGQVYGTELNEKAVDYRTIIPQEPFAVIMGNEGQGVRKELLQQTTQNVYLPMKGRAESLNVAVATGIILFRWQS